MPRKAYVAITNITNASLRLHHYPTSWKIAHVTTLAKTGKDHKFPQNYKPVSLLSCFGQIIEKVMLTRLQKHVYENQLIPSTRQGFTKNRSSNHQLFRVTEYITGGFNQHTAADAVFLDVAKAFHRVWHQGLLYKLLTRSHFTFYLVKTIRSYLHDETFRNTFYFNMQNK